jgi:hypothetical protein
MAPPKRSKKPKAKKRSAPKAAKTSRPAKKAPKRPVAKPGRPAKKKVATNQSARLLEELQQKLRDQEVVNGRLMDAQAKIFDALSKLTDAMMQVARGVEDVPPWRATLVQAMSVAEVAVRRFPPMLP